MYLNSVVAFSAIVLIAYLKPTKSLWTGFEVLAIKQINITDSKPLEFNLQMKRIKRSAFGISGTVVVTDSMQDYTGELILFHSPARNNNFKLIPAKIAEGTCCDKTNKEYRRYIMKDLHEVSDLPYTEDAAVDLCEMFTQGSTFTLRNYQFEKAALPQFLQPGYYKMLIKFMKDGAVYSGLEVLMDLS